MLKLSDFAVGQRVQLAPHTDHWMRGDRYGAVVAVGKRRKARVHVLADTSNRVLKLLPGDIADIVASARPVSW